jgi:hypothetical protein
LVRSLALAAASVVVTLVAVEGAFRIHDRIRPGQNAYTTEYSGKYYVDDPDLGYAVSPGAQVKARRGSRDTVIYNVTYTISEKGRRFTKGDPRGETWVFMGCSRTFGEGVNDDETLPSFYSAELGYSANVVNAGLHGYGPHQMLRILEKDRLGDLPSPVKHIVYQGLWEHVRRSAGRAVWDLRGPRYEIDGDSVSYAGPHHGARFIRAISTLRRSAAAEFFLERLYFNFDASDDDIELYARIVERTATLTREKLGAELTVLFWDEDNETARRVLARLTRSAIPVVRVSRLLPREEWKALEIPLDPHPRPEAYRRIAAGLAGHFGVRAASGADTRINPDNQLYYRDAREGRFQPPGSVQAGR